MPINDISLLPSDLRGKEAEAKAQASEAKSLPTFKMHVPEKELPKAASSVVSHAPQAGVSFGNGTKPEEKKGIFKIFKKVEQPAVPVAPVVTPKPKLKPDMWLKYFEPGTGLFKKVKSSYLNSRTSTAEYNWVIESEYWLKMRALLIVVLIVLIGLSIGWVGIKAYYNGRLDQYNALVSNVNAVNNEIKNRESNRDRAIALIDQAKVVQSVLADRVSWAQLFNVLERKTLANVSYIDFQIISESLVNLTVIAPDYSTLARQLEILEQTDGLQTADVDDASVAIDKSNDVQEVTATIKLTLAPEFWNK